MYIVCLLKPLVIYFFILTKLGSKVGYKLVVVHTRIFYFACYL